MSTESRNPPATAPHPHHHAHAHAPASFGRAFAIGVVLNTGFVVVETVYGLLAHSLALVADAGHNLTDVLGLLLAWGATALARREPTARHTYGLRRSTVLAALANAILLLLTVGALAWEAIRRLREAAPLETGPMIWVALVGIAVNTATALLFLRGRERDLNVRGAFVHMAADAAVSAGVVVAGVVIAVTGWVVLDPIVSLVILAVIVGTTWGLLTGSLNLALDAVPEGIDPRQVRDFLLSVPRVRDAHHLHIWGLSTTETALTAHLVAPEAAGEPGFLVGVQEGLRHRFGIAHSTLQVETGEEADCATRDCCD